jgi:hypothetical protein
MTKKVGKRTKNPFADVFYCTGESIPELSLRGIGSFRGVDTYCFRPFARS